MHLSQLESYIESNNYQELDRLLSEQPELIKIKTSHDISPLLLACYYNKPQIIRVLLKYNQGITIHEAIAAGLTSYVETILEQVPSVLQEISSQGYTPLGMAVHFNREDIVRLLLRKKADPNIPTQNEYSIYPLITAASNNHTGIAKLLIEAGAEVNVQQTSGETALHFAAQNANVDLIISLLENGADVLIANIQGLFPYNYALNNGHQEIAQILQPNSGF